MRETVEIQKAETAAIEPTTRTSAGCLLCGGALNVVLTGVEDNRLGVPGTYEIRKCSRCGFEQTYPVPGIRELTELYKKFYNFGGVKDTTYTRLRELFLFSFAYRFWVWLDGDVAFHSRKGRGRLLDVGCNEGRGMRIHQSNGFQVEGLELNENAAAVARQSGFIVHSCLIEEFDPQVGFDVAVLANVLEHSLDPRRMLSDVHRVLSPNGQVWISLPNSQSWLRRAFGRSWINWHVPFHISHFSQETLQRLLTESGFHKIEIQQISPALWVAQSMIASLFAKRGLKTQRLRSAFWTLVFMILSRLLLFPLLWWHNKHRQGDCLLAVATKT
jgi:SAM-dependent methyltransferase